jgi:hypothetical protein
LAKDMELEYGLEKIYIKGVDKNWKQKTVAKTQQAPIILV